MQKTIERATADTAQPMYVAPSRKWLSVAAVAVLGGAIGLGLTTLRDGAQLSPQDIAEVRAERMVEHQADLWARQSALTPQEIAERRAAQYSEAYERLWESRQP
jgi:hypothetical protein